MSWCMPILQHPAHRRNSGAPGRACLSAAAGAAVGPGRAQTAAHLPSSRHGPARLSAVHFLSVVECCLREHSPACPTAARIGAVAFIHRFGASLAALVLTPPEPIARIAALVPPPRAHRHRYYGVLAPSAPLRPVVTAQALAAHLRGLPTAVPALPRKDADHRLCQRCRHRGEISQPHRRITPTPVHCGCARATAVGGSRGGVAGAERSAMGIVSPARTGDRIRSAHRLVDAGR